MAKDLTKYRIQGTDKFLPKSRTVLACLTQFFKDVNVTKHPNTSWPDEIQGNAGLIKKMEDVENPRYYFMDEVLTDSQGNKYVVCNQWGAGNFERFLPHAAKMGYPLESNTGGESIVHQEKSKVANVPQQATSSVNNSENITDAQKILALEKQLAELNAKIGTPEEKVVTPQPIEEVVKPQKTFTPDPDKFGKLFLDEIVFFVGGLMVGWDGQGGRKDYEHNDTDEENKITAAIGKFFKFDFPTIEKKYFQYDDLEDCLLELKGKDPITKLLARWVALKVAYASNEGREECNYSDTEWELVKKIDAAADMNYLTEFEIHKTISDAAYDLVNAISDIDFLEDESDWLWIINEEVEMGEFYVRNIKPLLEKFFNELDKNDLWLEYEENYLALLKYKPELEALYGKMDFSAETWHYAGHIKPILDAGERERRKAAVEEATVTPEPATAGSSLDDLMALLDDTVEGSTSWKEAEAIAYIVRQLIVADGNVIEEELNWMQIAFDEFDKRDIAVRDAWDGVDTLGQMYYNLGKTDEMYTNCVNFVSQKSTHDVKSTLMNILQQICSQDDVVAKSEYKYLKIAVNTFFPGYEDNMRNSFINSGIKIQE